MVKITNTLSPDAGGARGVETKTGTVYIEPGETVDVDLLDDRDLYDGLVSGDAAAKKAAKSSADETQA